MLLLTLSNITLLCSNSDNVEIAKEAHADLLANKTDIETATGAARHRHKRDVTADTVAAYYVEIMFVLDHTIFD